MHVIVQYTDFFSRQLDRLPGCCPTSLHAARAALWSLCLCPCWCCRELLTTCCLAGFPQLGSGGRLGAGAQCALRRAVRQDCGTAVTEWSLTRQHSAACARVGPWQPSAAAFGAPAFPALSSCLCQLGELFFVSPLWKQRAFTMGEIKLSREFFLVFFCVPLPSRHVSLFLLSPGFRVLVHIAGCGLWCTGVEYFPLILFSINRVS